MKIVYRQGSSNSKSQNEVLVNKFAVVYETLLKFFQMEQSDFINTHSCDKIIIKQQSLIDFIPLKFS